MENLDMSKSEFDCHSGFIQENKRKSEPIRILDDDNTSQSIREKSNYSGKKRTINFGVSPEEHEKYMKERFPENEINCHNEDISTLSPKTNTIEATPGAADTLNNEMQTKNLPASINQDFAVEYNNLQEKNNLLASGLNSKLQHNPSLPTGELVLNGNQNLANLFRSQTKDKAKKNIYDMKECIKRLYIFFYTDSDGLRYYYEPLGYYQKFLISDLGKMVYATFDYDIVRQLNPYSDISSIYKALCYDPMIQSPTFIDNELCVNCINGVISIKNELGVNTIYFYDHNKQYGFLNCVNASYINYRSIENTHFWRFMLLATECDPELINLIREILGYILSNLNNAKKFFIIYGPSNSGKSVLLDLITNLVGEENVSNIEMEKLTDPKYTADLNGKLLNVCSELPDKGISDTGILKALVSEYDKVSARQIYKAPISFYNKAKLIFATNNLPEIKTALYKDNSAFFNRILIVPFLVSVPEEKQDKFLLKKLLAEKDIIFSWAIGGLISYINNGFSFSNSTKANAYLNNYRENGNRYISFIKLKCEISQDKYIYADDLFAAYENFCYENLLDKPIYRDIRCLKKILLDTFNVTYKRIHRDGSNKWGFDGIGLLR